MPADGPGNNIDSLSESIVLTIPFLHIFSYNTFNSLRPRWHRHHYANNIFKCTFLIENVWTLIRFHWSLFLRVQFTIFQHWFWWWLGADQVTRHYLNQWWWDYRRMYASFSLIELTNFKCHSADQTTSFTIADKTLWAGWQSNLTGQCFTWVSMFPSTRHHYAIITACNEHINLPVVIDQSVIPRWDSLASLA